MHARPSLGSFYKIQVLADQLLSAGSYCFTFKVYANNGGGSSHRRDVYEGTPKSNNFLDKT